MKSILAASALAGGLALAVAGTAAAAHPANSDRPQQRCLQIGRIYSWNADKTDRSLVIESDTRDKFRLDLMGYCPGLRFTETIALRSPGGTALSCVSPGDMIYFRSAGMIQHCAIRRVTPLAKPHRPTHAAAAKSSKTG